MMDLSTETCQACRPGAPTVSETEARVLLAQLPSWRVVEHEGVRQLQRVFAFPDFAAATRHVGRQADQWAAALAIVEMIT